MRALLTLLSGLTAMSGAAFAVDITTAKNFSAINSMATVDKEFHFDSLQGWRDFSFRLIGRSSAMRFIRFRDFHRRAVSLEWRTGDFANGWRTEIADKYLAPNDIPMYYSFWLKLPEDFRLPEGKSTVLMQFHTPDALHKPQIAFRYRWHGSMDVSLNHATVKNHEEARRKQLKVHTFKNLELGKWHFFEFLLVWSKHPERGFIQLQHNHQPVLHYKGQTNYANQATGAYFKFGPYPAKNIQARLQAYYGPYRRITNPPQSFINRQFSGN